MTNQSSNDERWNVGFVEARQDEVIRKILEHCGLWRDPPPRAPPSHAPAAVPARTAPEPDARFNCEVHPDYLEHLHRESQVEQLDVRWEP